MKNYLWIIWDDGKLRNVDLIPYSILQRSELAGGEHPHAEREGKSAYQPGTAYFNLTRNGNTITLEYTEDLNKDDKGRYGSYIGKTVITFNDRDDNSIPKMEWYSRHSKGKHPFSSTSARWITTEDLKGIDSKNLFKMLLDQFG